MDIKSSKIAYVWHIAIILWVKGGKRGRMGGRMEIFIGMSISAEAEGKK